MRACCTALSVSLQIRAKNRRRTRFAAIVALEQADHLWCPLALVLEPAELDARREAENGFGVRVRQLLLNELEGRQGDLELLAVQGVVQRPVNAVFKCALSQFNCAQKLASPAYDHAKGDAKAGVAESMSDRTSL